MWREAGWRWIDGGTDERWIYQVEAASGKRKLSMRELGEHVSEPPVPSHAAKVRKSTVKVLNEHVRLSRGTN